MHMFSYIITFPIAHCSPYLQFRLLMVQCLGQTSSPRVALILLCKLLRLQPEAPAEWASEIEHEHISPLVWVYSSAHTVVYLAFHKLNESDTITHTLHSSLNTFCHKLHWPLCRCIKWILNNRKIHLSTSFLLMDVGRTMHNSILDRREHYKTVNMPFFFNLFKFVLMNGDGETVLIPVSFIHFLFLLFSQIVLFLGWFYTYAFSTHQSNIFRGWVSLTGVNCSPTFGYASGKQTIIC